MFDRLEQAIYDTVHDYHGGAVALAPRVGMNAGTLSNKANPGMETHSLSLRESIPIQREAQDYRILYAYASVLDHAAVELGDHAAASDVELLSLYTDYQAQIGRMAGHLHQALQDRRINKAEAANVKAALDRSIRAGLELMSRVEALADA